MDRSKRERGEERRAAKTARRLHLATHINLKALEEAVEAVQRAWID